VEADRRRTKRETLRCQSTPEGDVRTYVVEPSFDDADDQRQAGAKYYGPRGPRDGVRDDSKPPPAENGGQSSQQQHLSAHFSDATKIYDDPSAGAGGGSSGAPTQTTGNAAGTMSTITPSVSVDDRYMPAQTTQAQGSLMLDQQTNAQQGGAVAGSESKTETIEEARASAAAAAAAVAAVNGSGGQQNLVLPRRSPVAFETLNQDTSCDTPSAELMKTDLLPSPNSSQLLAAQVLTIPSIKRSPGVGQKHRRGLSSGYTNPNVAHRRMNSGGNAAPVDRQDGGSSHPHCETRKHSRGPIPSVPGGIGKVSHQRENSVGLSIEMLTAAANASNDVLAEAAGVPPPRRSSASHGGRGSSSPRLSSDSLALRGSPSSMLQQPQLCGPEGSSASGVPAGTGARANEAGQPSTEYPAGQTRADYRPLLPPPPVMERVTYRNYHSAVARQPSPPPNPPPSQHQGATSIPPPPLPPPPPPHQGASTAPYSQQSYQPPPVQQQHYYHQSQPPQSTYYPPPRNPAPPPRTSPGPPPPQSGYYAPPPRTSAAPRRTSPGPPPPHSSYYAPPRTSAAPPMASPGPPPPPPHQQPYYPPPRPSQSAAVASSEGGPPPPYPPSQYTQPRSYPPPSRGNGYYSNQYALPPSNDPAGARSHRPSHSRQMSQVSVGSIMERIETDEPLFTDKGDTPPQPQAQAGGWNAAPGGAPGAKPYATEDTRPLHHPGDVAMQSTATPNGRPPPAPPTQHAPEPPPHRQVESYVYSAPETARGPAPAPAPVAGWGHYHHKQSSASAFIETLTELEHSDHFLTQLSHNANAAPTYQQAAASNAPAPYAAPQPSPQANASSAQVVAQGEVARDGAQCVPVGAPTGPPVQPPPRQETAGAPPRPAATPKTTKRVRRKCTVGNCPNRVVQGGLCIAHGAKRKMCSHPGCTKNVKKAGLCSTHGPSRKKCQHEGCNKVAVQGGVCIAHGARKKLCSVDECSKQAIMGGMCKKHHDQAHGIASPRGNGRKPSIGAGSLPGAMPSLCLPIGGQAKVAPVNTNQPSQPSGAEPNSGHHRRGLSIFQDMGAVATIIGEDGLADAGVPLAPPPRAAEKRGEEEPPANAAPSQELRQQSSGNIDGAMQPAQPSGGGQAGQQGGKKRSKGHNRGLSFFTDENVADTIIGNNIL